MGDIVPIDNQDSELPIKFVKVAETELVAILSELEMYRTRDAAETQLVEDSKVCLVEVQEAFGITQSDFVDESGLTLSESKISSLMIRKLMKMLPSLATESGREKLRSKLTVTSSFIQKLAAHASQRYNQKVL